MSKQQFDYIPDSRVCSQQITIETEDGIITHVQVVKGCEGNSKGVAALLVGMSVEDAISRLQGITCGRKDTSCPDQIAKALLTMANNG